MKTLLILLIVCYVVNGRSMPISPPISTNVRYDMGKPDPEARRIAAIDSKIVAFGADDTVVEVNREKKDGVSTGRCIVRSTTGNPEFVEKDDCNFLLGTTDKIRQKILETVFGHNDDLQGKTLTDVIDEAQANANAN